MTKEEFNKLSSEIKKDLVTDALCNLLMFNDLAPSVCASLIKPCNYDVIRIVLSAYRNGEIN